MTRQIYLKQGHQSLPKLANIELVLDGNNVTPSPLAEEQSAGLADSAAFLEDTDLKARNAGRVVRKTTERQSRWIIDVAVGSWQSYKESTAVSSQINNQATGLFLGLGTIDCEDDDAPIAFDGTAKDYAASMLSNAKPLAGLTLLNSTAASHIAQLTGIMGVNSVFSPFADAGAQAIIEAYFTIKEERCEQALVAAGSQKITPWYFLAYRDFIQSWDWPGAFPTESASALLATHDKQHGDACLLSVKRSFVHKQSSEFPLLNDLLSELNHHNISTPEQVIYTGGFRLTEKRQQSLQKLLPEVDVCYLDRLIGYTGAAGALHGVNLAIAMLKQGLGISNSSESANIKTLSGDTLLLIAEGFNGQICYLIIGGMHDA